MKYLYLAVGAGAAFAYAGHTGNSDVSLLTWIAVFAVCGRWYVAHRAKG